ncbi:ATP-dependent DNA helicase [Thiohalorhabdus sp. Cl-TMA]|uniref:DNA 5'-3' helicase n=1 Tax=Thiohalorhabdus methylotrophus TaxID=3242694 RepID=A0ABV4U149_9GAMM
MTSATTTLGPEGPLAEALDNFQPRPEQQEMAAAVEDALANQGTLVAEAGTGTGKTFAYLVPVLQSGRKVLVSTGTRNLQDQLYHRDLPLLRRALGADFRTALLKGRANYLCLHRLERAVYQERELSGEQRADLARIREWAGHTTHGDRAEVTSLAEDAAIWPRVTSTSDNCLGTECEHYDDCFLIQARRRAQEADVVVVNHYLFCADLNLKSEGVGELLPKADAVVFDEAHQLPEAASRFFGTGISNYGLRELARDSRDEFAQEAGDDPQLPEAAHALERAAGDWRRALGENDWRGAWKPVLEQPAPRQAFDALRASADRLQNVLEIHAERGKGLGRAFERAKDLNERLNFLYDADDPDFVFWMETRGRGAFVHATPLEVAGPFQRATGGAKGQAWVFTSATLAVGESFTHFCARLGLPGDVATRKWESPFHFDEQARLYHPPRLPDPGSPAYTDRLLDAALPVVAASPGGAFFLFTSHRALRQAADRLRREGRFPLLVQGDAPRDHLIHQFRSKGNVVLLGTGSFWEGVDVRGAALSVVVIDKLPFPSPADPVIEARDRYLKEKGLEPFPHEHLPTAVLTLKQGAGRLIRDASDAGVLIIGDPRLTRKSYGKTFMESLPPMPRTYDLGEVQRFLAREGNAEVEQTDHNR